jgi:hypothetical protein
VIPPRLQSAPGEAAEPVFGTDGVALFTVWTNAGLLALPLKFESPL